MRVLVTGASGFVGSHVVEHLLNETDHEVVGTYSYYHRGDPTRLVHMIGHPRLTLVRLDLAAPFGKMSEQLGRCDVVLNIASESHVDRSIEDPVPFVQNNIALTLNVLEYCREVSPSMVVQFSTDEVYGPAPDGVYHAEWAPIIPSNPYAASKAAQEAIAVSYWRTYGVPLVVTNTMNVIGERQDPEKFVPGVIAKVLAGETVVVHADASGRPGARHYIHARCVADALTFLMSKCDTIVRVFAEGVVDRPARYNIVGEVERDNLTLAHEIASLLNAELKYELVDFHSARPGHDRRYALDGAALAALGWQHPESFEEGLARTVRAAREDT